MPLPYCITIPTGEQSGADENSFMRPHPSATPVLWFCIDIHALFKKLKNTCAHTQSLWEELPIKEEMHQTSHSLANSACELALAPVEEMVCYVKPYMNFL